MVTFLGILSAEGDVENLSKRTRHLNPGSQVMFTKSRKKS